MEELWLLPPCNRQMQGIRNISSISSPTPTGRHCAEDGASFAPVADASRDDRSAEREPAYLRLLFVLLGTATFFQGYDAGIPAVILPDLARDFRVGTATLGIAIAVVNLGALLSFSVIALGDRFGRRPLLISTTLLYALFTGLTAGAQSILAFGAMQFMARIFLVAELATAVTIATEEFPAARRGRAIGALFSLGGIGVIVAAVVFRFLAGTPLGWRGLYLMGTLPLVGVAVLRARLRESRRWLEAKASGAHPAGVGIGTVMRGPYRRRLFAVAGAVGLANFAILGAAAYWSYFARIERGLSVETANVFLAGGLLLGLPGYIVAGRLQDRIGRRPTAALFLLGAMVVGVIAFQAHARPLMFAALAASVFLGFGATPVLSSIAAELFPTEIRATASALAGSAAGTIGASSGFLVIGVMASGDGPVGTVGGSVSLAALALFPAVALLLTLPETAGRDLEQLRVWRPADEPGSPGA